MTFNLKSFLKENQLTSNSKLISELDVRKGNKVLVLELAAPYLKDYFYENGNLYDVIKKVSQEYLKRELDSTPFEQLYDLVDYYKEWGLILMNKKRTIGSSVINEDNYISFLFISNRDHRFLEEGSEEAEYVNLLEEINVALDENDIVQLSLPIPEEYLDND